MSEEKELGIKCEGCGCDICLCPGAERTERWAKAMFGEDSDE